MKNYLYLLCLSAICFACEVSSEKPFYLENQLTEQDIEGKWEINEIGNNEEKPKLCQIRRENDYYVYEELEGKNDTEKSLIILKLFEFEKNLYANANFKEDAKLSSHFLLKVDIHHNNKIILYNIDLEKFIKYNSKIKSPLEYENKSGREILIQSSTEQIQDFLKQEHAKDIFKKHFVLHRK